MRLTGGYPRMHLRIVNAKNKHNENLSHQPTPFTNNKGNRIMDAECIIFYDRLCVAEAHFLKKIMFLTSHRPDRFEPPGKNNMLTCYVHIRTYQNIPNRHPALSGDQVDLI